MNFLPENISNYAEEYTSSESALLKDLDRNTQAKVLLPRMLSGKLQGRCLSFISKLKQPKRVLEVGTYTGYSALCLAEGLQADGKLFSIDKNEELYPFAMSFIEKSKYKDQIQLISGDATEEIDKLEGPFDLIFIDADKHNYLNYYKQVMPKLSVGGLIIADNVLWSGKVVDPKADDLDTVELRKFNSQVQEDPMVENILLPVRDGLMIIRKVSES